MYQIMLHLIIFTEYFDTKTNRNITYLNISDEKINIEIDYTGSTQETWRLGHIDLFNTKNQHINSIINSVEDIINSGIDINYYDISGYGYEPSYVNLIDMVPMSNGYYRTDIDNDHKIIITIDTNKHNISKILYTPVYDISNNSSQFTISINMKKYDISNNIPKSLLFVDASYNNGGSEYNGMISNLYYNFPSNEYFVPITDFSNSSVFVDDSLQSAEEISYTTLVGDIDNNNIVDVSDSRLLTEWIADISKSIIETSADRFYKKGDINEDGTITASDGVYMKTYVYIQNDDNYNFDGVYNKYDISDKNIIEDNIISPNNNNNVNNLIVNEKMTIINDTVYNVENNTITPKYTPNEIFKPINTSYESSGEFIFDKKSNRINVKPQQFQYKIRSWRKR